MQHDQLLHDQLQNRTRRQPTETMQISDLARSEVSLPSLRDHLGPDAFSPPAMFKKSPLLVDSSTDEEPSKALPREFYNRDPMSPPDVLLPPSPFYPFPPSRMTLDHPYVDTPSPDGDSGSDIDELDLNIMPLSNSADVGGYICKFEGCRARPFQTQYLLNSHANIHAQSRPHYCPVKGCPRSEGGKGFKRKNEMIRHGFLHESPGYVCPFCPDREHKYPRPDNLQRYVSFSCIQTLDITGQYSKKLVTLGMFVFTIQKRTKTTCC